MPATANYNSIKTNAALAGRKCGTGYDDTDTDGQYDDRAYFGNFWHVPSVTIPQGATILSATWTVLSQAWDYIDTGSPGVQWKGIFSAADVDDATYAAGITHEECNAISTTTATAEWTKSAGWTVPIVCPNDLASPIQEVVDRGGWVSGNDMIFFWKDNGSTAPEMDPWMPTTNYARLGEVGVMTFVITYIP